MPGINGLNKNSLSIDINQGNLNDLKLNRRSSKNFTSKNKENNLLSMDLNMNMNNINGEEKFKRRGSRSNTRKSTKKEVQIQNLNISIDDLIRHLNFFEFFFEMELVRKFLIHKIKEK